MVRSAKSLRPLHLCGEKTFKHIHRGGAEHAEEAQRILKRENSRRF